MTADARTSAGITERSSRLREEGLRLLAAAWDDGAGMVRHETPLGIFHDARASLAYAGALLAGGVDITRSERAIRNVLTMQERHEDDAHYGNFKWFFEDACVTDLNAVEFVLDGLNDIALHHAAALPASLVADVHEAIALGLAEIDRLDVHPSYTNIALSDICSSVLGGEIIGDDGSVARGRRRLDEWHAFTNASGAPHEFNSPTYAAVDILRMASLAESTRDPEIALKARVAEERLWLHVAAHYDPTLAQLAGPHSRSYRDGWTGAGGYLKLLLWKLLGDDNLRRPTPYFPKGREEGHLGIAKATLHCPTYVIDMLRERPFPFETQETTDATGLDISTYMTTRSALGVASRAYDVGDLPERWPQYNSVLLHFEKEGAPGFGVLYARYIINDKDVGAVVHESNRNAEDLWDEGVFVAAQHRGRAIVAYGLQPRNRPVHSAKLSVRLLGAGDAWLGDRRVTSFPAPVSPGEPVIIDCGGAYVAVIPLAPSDMGSDAPIELVHDGNQLILDVYNYKGPPKSFWEHRSQSGPFFKGNVRNAVILEVADRDAFADIDAFRAHIAAARIADSVGEDFEREVAYASGGGSLTLRYNLRDMRLVERRHDGKAYVPPMARAGALDGTGAQSLFSRESLIELAGAKLLAGPEAKWLAADPDRERYVFVHPEYSEEPVWLETPRCAVECEAFAFGRIEVDDREQRIEIEAAGEIGALRVRGEPSLTLHINGRDATGMLAPPDPDSLRDLR